jgi:hypothetical protein
LDLQNSFEDKECMHYSLLKLIPFFLLVGTNLRFSSNSFAKQQMAACSLSKEFCANPRNDQPTRRGELISALLKRVWQTHKVLMLSDQELINSV